MTVFVLPLSSEGLKFSLIRLRLPLKLVSQGDASGAQLFEILLGPYRGLLHGTLMLDLGRLKGIPERSGRGLDLRELLGSGGQGLLNGGILLGSQGAQALSKGLDGRLELRRFLGVGCGGFLQRLLMRDDRILQHLPLCSECSLQFAEFALLNRLRHVFASEVSGNNPALWGTPYAP